jgi:superfamily II DNA/RNA helicase
MGSILSAFSPRSKERPPELAGEGQIDLLIATDCISEGQNLQDCDYLVNYDIHWNPVRIIQRFGRIDRIGSANARIQLVNFWPNMELDEYLDLESRVSGRMVLLDVSATGEENVIEFQAGNQMNDLEYRRAQLQKLQDAVIDLEDLSSGVSIADQTLNDFRIDLAGVLKENRARLEDLPLGTYAVTTATGEAGNADVAIPPGAIFCLRAVGEAAQKAAEPGYPLNPHFVVHIGADGEVLLPYTQAKQETVPWQRDSERRRVQELRPSNPLRTRHGPLSEAVVSRGRGDRRQERRACGREPVFAGRHACSEGRIRRHE